MLITRIFRVRIIAGLRKEFESTFASVSVGAVESAAGNIVFRILRPTRWAPDEYAMISVWDSEESLQAFAGDDWSRPVIPPGMEHYFQECWVHHYLSWE